MNARSKRYLIPFFLVVFPVTLLGSDYAAQPNREQRGGDEDIIANLQAHQSTINAIWDARLRRQGLAAVRNEDNHITGYRKFDETGDHGPSVAN
jgi:hypothetical protein